MRIIGKASGKFAGFEGSAFHIDHNSEHEWNQLNLTELTAIMGSPCYHPSENALVNKFESKFS